MEKNPENIPVNPVSGTEAAKSFEITRLKDGEQVNARHDLICEEPLLISIEKKPYSVIMRTPGDEIFHVAGFCLAEGIIDDYTDFNNIDFYSGSDTNVVEVTLRLERLEKISSLLERKGFINLAGCGLCGKRFIEEISLILQHSDMNKKITVNEIYRASSRLMEAQRLYKDTRGSHAIVILDKNLDVISKGEDVGRHNAFDKAVGSALMNGRLKNAYVAVLTSRISFEMIQKANRAGISFMVSKSRPTALAVELGRSLNMTLVCHSEGKDMAIFSGQERIIW